MNKGSVPLNQLVKPLISYSVESTRFFFQAWVAKAHSPCPHPCEKLYPFIAPAPYYLYVTCTFISFCLESYWAVLFTFLPNGL